MREREREGGRERERERKTERERERARERVIEAVNELGSKSLHRLSELVQNIHNESISPYFRGHCRILSPGFKGGQDQALARRQQQMKSSTTQRCAKFDRSTNKEARMHTTRVNPTQGPPDAYN